MSHHSHPETLEVVVTKNGNRYVVVEDQGRKWLAYLDHEDPERPNDTSSYAKYAGESGTIYKPDDPVVRVGTAAFIRDSDGRVLMGKRKGSHGAHTWCVPGGHVDFGEEPSESVRREIMEETGLAVGTVFPCLNVPWVNSHFRDAGKQYITLYFSVEYIGGQPKIMEPEKCDGWAWFSIDDLPEPLFEPLAYHQILGKLDDKSAWLDMVSSRR